MITVALDEDREAVLSHVEQAAPGHPSLIDENRIVPDLFNMVNVPTAVWIDEKGKIVRPNDVAFGDDRFRDFTHVAARPHQDALRAWVARDRVPFDDGEIRDRMRLPSARDQLARAEYRVASWLARRGRKDAAEPHFIRAEELAPHDFTIRRGSLPLRGISPRGPVFARMHREWLRSGNSYYHPLSEDG